MKKRKLTMICCMLTCLTTTVSGMDVPLNRTLKSKQEMDPRAFFVGSVMRSYDLTEPHTYKGIDFSDYINDSAKTIKSVTKELHWDYKNGLAKMDTPNSQGATGFLQKMGKVKLSDVVIECKNQFATILVISLDGKPIKTSEKLLIQSGQDDKLFGYKERAFLDSAGNKTDRKEISDIGQYPYNVVRTSAVVTLKSMTDVEKIVVLDENGYPRQQWADWKKNLNGNTVVMLPEDSMYTVVLRGDAAKTVKIQDRETQEFGEGIEYVWWEGEDYSYIKNFNTDAFDPDEDFPDNKQMLSNGAWLTNEGEWTDADTDDPPVVKYKVTVKSDGSYSFFVRKFWYHGHFRWKFDDGEWNTVDNDVALLDYTFLKKNLGAYWVQLSDANLTAGEHVLEIQQMPRSNQKAFGVDCFLLSKIPFRPIGLLRPGEKSGKANVGMWSFEPESESFTSENLLDLRYLNEEVAGQAGPLTQKDGKIYLGSGEEVKLWGVNVTPSNVFKSDHTSLKYAARLMAKYGVNYVRIHGSMWDSNFKTREKDINKLQYFINELKNNGIYTKISSYFVLWNALHQNDQFKHVGEVGSDGVVGFLEYNKEGYAFIIWNEDLQNVHFDALKTILTAENPYTGVPLAKEPAVGVIEVQNEDSFFFSTFANWRWPDVDRVKFNQLFGKWLMNRYGTVSKTLRAWGDIEPASPPSYADDYNRLAFDIQGVNDFLGTGGVSWVSKRKADVYRFITETQRDYYQTFIDRLKNELGYEGLTIASNWVTTDNRRLDAAERYTYLPADITDKHGYADNVKHTTDRKYEVNVGDKLVETPVILNPSKMPAQSVNTKGQATSISEINWINPSSFKVDEPFFLAAYGSLQGIDMFNTFQSSNLNWETGYTKWSEAVPSRMGQWPGFALAFRRGDIKEAQVVAHENISREAIDNLPAVGTKIYNGINLDDYRK